MVYQIYPRSFADSGDNPRTSTDDDVSRPWAGAGTSVGDLQGIRDHLDHLAWLGVDAIWISPFYPSPMKDAGYDISDYCDVDRMFGSLDTFDALLADAHARGIRILVDFVPNHTSDEHPWFIESRSRRDSPRRDWYIWRDEPNDWRASLGAGSAWQWDEKTQQYYLHLFLPGQPDLNWREPAVSDAMHDVLRFWMDRGVDGFRIDAVHCVGKDPTFADDPRCAAGIPLSSFNDQPFSHEVLRGIRKLVDSYPGDRVTVGEVNIRNPEVVAQYYGRGEELHLAFNFPLLDAPWDAVLWRQVIRDTTKWFEAAGAWPTWVLSNHDNGRPRNRYGGSMRRTRAAALLLLTLRGTPFIYQGDELGLEDVVVDDKTRVDPGGRDGSRGPLPWQPGFPYGWHGDHPWLPFPPDADRLNVASQRADRGSTLHLYRALLAARRATRALRVGDFAELDSNPWTVAYRRCHGDQERVVVVNFDGEPGQLTLPGRWCVEIDTAGYGGEADRAGTLFDGCVPAETGLLLRPVDGHGETDDGRA